MLELISNATAADDSPMTENLWSLTTGADATVSLRRPFDRPTLRFGDGRNSLVHLVDRQRGPSIVGPTTLQVTKAARRRLAGRRTAAPHPRPVRRVCLRGRPADCSGNRLVWHSRASPRTFRRTARGSG